MDPRVGLDGCGKSRLPLGFDPWTVQPIASRCTDKAIPSHIEIDNTNQWRTQEFFWGGGQQIQLRTERTGIWGRSPLVRGSGGSCNLIQEISFHIVKFS